MLSKLGLPGDTMVDAGTDQQLVSAHAVRNANGDLSVMLINKDPANSYQVSLHYAGFTPAAGAPTVYAYGDEASSITSAAQGSSTSQTLPPYSIETVVLAPAGGQRERADRPGRPVGEQRDRHAGDRSPGARRPAARWTSTRSTGSSAPTANCSALPRRPRSPWRTSVPGTAYTLNVLAVDQSGYLSPPSRRSGSPPARPPTAPAR